MSIHYYLLRYIDSNPYVLTTYVRRSRFLSLEISILFNFMLWFDPNEYMCPHTWLHLWKFAYMFPLNCISYWICTSMLFNGDFPNFCCIS